MVFIYNMTAHVTADGKKQGNTQNTIQGKIETVLEKMTDSEIEIHGSGRTDAGVHALQQVANFKCDTPKDTGSDHGISEHVSTSL